MRRYPLLLLGHLAFVIGLIGLFVPGIPGVLFWLVAVWAYSRTCPYLAEKLLAHPRCGPVLRDWHNHRVIPARAKIYAGITMLVSLGALSFMATHWLMPLTAGVCMSAVYAFIISRPSIAPAAAANKTSC